MLEFVRRWLVYLLIPLGAVLLILPVSTQRMGTVYRDALFLQVVPGGDSAPDVPEALWVQFPQLRAAARTTLHPPWNGLGVDSSAPVRHRSVDLEDWKRFQEALGQVSEPIRFSFEDQVLVATTAPAEDTELVEVPHLRPASRSAGGVLLALGLVLVFGLYRKPGDGIQVGPSRAMAVWDIVVVVVTGFFAWWLVDTVFVRALGTASEWNEPFSEGMSVFWMGLALPVIALIAAGTSAQVVWIDGQGIRLKGLWGVRQVGWAELSGLSVSEIHAPRSVSGTPAARKATQLLVIEGRETTLRVMDPPLVSTKNAILDALTNHAPEEWREKIRETGQHWKSVL